MIPDAKTIESLKYYTIADLKAYFKRPDFQELVDAESRVTGQGEGSLRHYLAVEHYRRKRRLCDIADELHISPFSLRTIIDLSGWTVLTVSDETTEYHTGTSPRSTIYFRSCPKCVGELQTVDDVFGRYLECVQCGYEAELMRPVIHRSSGKGTALS